MHLLSDCRQHNNPTKGSGLCKDGWAASESVERERESLVEGGEKKKEKAPQAGVVKGNWRDVVASVAAEPRLSEVHGAQSHDS